MAAQLERFERATATGGMKRRGILAAAAMAAGILATKGSQPVAAVSDINFVATMGSGTAFSTTGTTYSTGINVTGSVNGVVGNCATGGAAVYGISMTQNGVYGTSTSGIGVGGNSTSNTGVLGNSSSGYGVVGTSTSSLGVFADGAGGGVYATSSSGNGVNGNSSSGTGVSGNSSSGNGVNGTSMTQNGVYGTSTSGIGVGGNSTSNTGVLGNSSSGYGVVGTSTSSLGVFADGAGGGVYATSSSTNGVHGVTNATPATQSRPPIAGVFGSGNGTNTAGVSGDGNGNGVGVVGYSAGNIGVYGISRWWRGAPYRRRRHGRVVARLRALRHCHARGHRRLRGRGQRNWRHTPGSSAGKRNFYRHDLPGEHGQCLRGGARRDEERGGEGGRWQPSPDALCGSAGAVVRGLW